MKWWKQAGSRLTSELGYPSLFRTVINTLPVDAEFDLAPNAAIERRATIEGSVSMAPHSEISRGSFVRGSLRLDRSAVIGENVVSRGNVTVGPWSNLNRRVEVIGDINIGGFTPLARYTALIQRDHETSKPSLHARFKVDCLGNSLEPPTKGPITVGNDAWLGKGVLVLSGVTIGDGAVVAAGSIVTDDVEPFSVVAGVPAEHKHWRFDKPTREALQEIAWWEWSDEKLRANSEFFATDLTTVDDVYELL